MTVPDPEDEKQQPVSRGTSEMDPGERQFWDLDDEDALLDEFDDLEDGEPAGTQPEEPEQPAEAPATSEEPAEEPAAEEPEPRRRPDKKSTEEPDRVPPKSPMEKISLIVFGVLMLGVVAGALALFYGELPTDDPNAPADFPVKGTNVVIKGIETYWRDPREGKDRGIQATVKIIPAAEIVLKKGGGSGAIRVFFEDDHGDLIGDPMTFAVSNGTFANGKDRVEAYCTEGFADQGDYPAYVTGQIEPWFLIVKEGPSTSARGNQFVDVLRTPIFAERR